MSDYDQEHDMAPMDGDMRALLRRSSPREDDVAGAAQARVFTRLAASLPIAAYAAGAAGAAGAGAKALASTSLSAASHAGRVGAPLAASFWSAKVVGLACMTFLVGSGAGALVTRGLGPERERVVYIERPAPTALRASAGASAPSSTQAVLGERIEDLPRAPTSRTTLPSAIAPSATSQVRAERDLIDEARTKFAQGDPSASLRLLDEHAKKYPSGVLVEEREALAVRALAGSGRAQEAATRGHAFIQRFPQSLMLPAVQAAIGEPSSGK